MLNKNKIRFIVSLQKKRIRDEHRLYIIEGDKMIREYLSAGIPVKSLIAKPEFISSLSENILDGVETEAVSYDELKKISALKTPHNALALVSMPDQETNPRKLLKDWCLALDCIQDPGNLGTIIRAAAWFGIKNIVCSEDSVDSFNPKTIQASMGAIIQVNVSYLDLIGFLGLAAEKQVPVYGTVLNGESIYDQNFEKKGIILFGNESKGISDSLIPFITRKIMIPKFSKSAFGLDSLNAAMAATVVLYEISSKRNK